MNAVYHKANSRGHSSLDWLDSWHTFSFADYYNSKRMHFGVLRVLNDDIVQPSKGFGRHPHDNMEIISLPISGDLEHKDSIGNTSVIREGDIQVLSAGSGIFHSEYNKNSDKAVNFLQIWIYPKLRKVEPRYDQMSLSELEKENSFSQILSPNMNDQGLWIHQDAWFHIGRFEERRETSYTLKKEGNGIYIFVIEGEIEVGGQRLERRDGFGLWNINSIQLKSLKESFILLMEVPMSV